MTLPVAKAARLLHIQEMLLATPDGLTQAEIARKLGVNRSTVSRYLPDLDEFCVYEQDDGRLAIDRDNYLSQVQLTLHEAMALHLAARLMATRTDKHNPHAASALRKLGLALEQLAPLFSRHLLASAAVMDDQARRYDPVYLDVLETLTRAWSQGRKVRVWHRLVDGQVFEYEFSPYFIEPYAVGHTSHAIGFREPPGALRTFKLERIQKAELTETAYTIPASFDARGVLANAWGVWYTEDEPVDVVLKFHPRVAQRVRETQWHWSEEVEELADGGLIWRARIAEPQEMVPWIRGWGADVEVLEPEGVRKGIVKDVRRMANVYDLEPIATYQLLWAKTSRVDGAEHTHPLICHMLDVAAVAQVMWDDALTDGLRDQFAGALGLDPAETGRLLAFWAGLHDLGKASPAFQRKYRPSIAPLEEAGLSFPTVIGRERYGHGIGSAYVLASILEDELSLPRGLAKGVARAVGGHHGEWPAPGALHDTRLRTQLGDAGWDEIRAGLVKNLERACQLPAVTGWSLPREGQNAFLTLLSGFVSVADWIGSMEEYFGYVEAPVDELEYFGEAVARAGVALSALKWLDWQPPGEAVSFEELCAVPSLRPMQSEIVRLAAALDGPALVIIEAPTGVGKTEAALYLADHWARTCRQRGCYIAMPTMATSNQMFERYGTVVERRFPELEARPLLVHGQAHWAKDAASPRVVTAGDSGDEERHATDTMGWFLPRKRSLLAPLGVGTVDQALLSVLQTRHFFVRLFGLSHKTVIFDEVHAYDTYMSTLFQRLLGWLRVVDASVVVLSATLPAKMREELLRAYCGSSEVQIPEVEYPAVTWATAEAMGTLAVPAPQEREVEIVWCDRDPAGVVGVLEEALEDGGCAAVICNTVGRSQELYDALCEAHIVDDDDLILFHARFPQHWRDEIESLVLRQFGKGSAERPRRAIVVATQVIEQSLDLDFDIMVTDLAPVDLLIQRAGRLHRHTRSGRPARLARPRLVITTPDTTGGMLQFGSDEHIYAAYVLLRSYLALQGKELLSLPRDTAELIERVYGADDPLPVDPAMRAALDRARERMAEDEGRDVFDAKKRLVRWPDDERLMNQDAAALEEDNPELHTVFQALTRLGPRNISVVCLHRTPEGLNTLPDGSGMQVDLSVRPDGITTGSLARAAMKVTHYAVVNHFYEQDVPVKWQDHPLLQRYRVTVFEAGHCSLAGANISLELTREKGLMIIKENSS